MVSLIEANGLVKDYRSVRALDDVSLKVGRGEIFGFFGPNGAGKTTCIKVLCGLTSPTQGGAEVLGIDASKLDPLVDSSGGIASFLMAAEGGQILFI